ncbi:hypothetical protein AB0M94_03235 [Streptomyces xanthochromogenes]|uniref:Uncharacterized protein n=1 Tax=Streptomyces xanthochromogenes TaxID=67384 RepID=A0ABQ2ZN72_9ACTN|nr:MULTISPECIES: hypothetical protein [Streptomyces]MYV95401.1 hypothetical protein [Streptomyces sp. SID1034]GGY17810.1 hypothetical protein GCM10010326_07820 [Streptomyces xanthochromogenes]
MKKKIVTLALVGAVFAGVAPAAHAVDVNQEYNSAGCYLGKKKDPKACERLLAGKPMSKTAKDCLVKAGIGGAAALIVGRINKDLAKKIATNVVAGGVTGCLSSLA